MCCGKNRAAAQAAAMSAGIAGSSRSRVTPAPPALDRTSILVFEYLGRAPATIRGAASGRSYHFVAAGDRVQVDARDRPSLVANPLVRWIR